MVCSFPVNPWAVAVLFSLGCIGEIAAEDHLYRFWDDGNVGYMDASGTVVIPARYPEAQAFFNGQAVVVVEVTDRGKVWAVIDTQGDYRIRPTADRPLWFTEGRWVMIRHGEDDGLFGDDELRGDTRYLADEAGRPVGDGVRYRILYALREGRAVVEVDGQCGYIDRDGTLVIEPRFEWLAFFRDGVAIIREGEHCGIIDMVGEWVVEPTYDDMSVDFIDGLAFAVQGDRWGVIDTEGNWVQTLDHPLPDLFNGGLARVEVISPLVINPELVDHPYYLVNLRGEHSAFTVEDDGVFFNDGLLAIIRDGKLGYINEDFEIVIPCQFQHPDPEGHDYRNRWEWRVDFRDGVAPAMMEDRWGYIDREGGWLIEPRFAVAEHFRGELALVKDDETVGYINREGDYVWRTALDEMTPRDADASRAR